MGSVAVRILALSFAMLLAAPASADDTGDTHVDELQVGTFAGAIQVAGSATFVDVADQVALDATGDSASPIPGTDLTGISISRPDPTRNNLVFTMGIADQPPAPVSGTPYVIYYNWELRVIGPGGEASTTYMLQANRLMGSKLPNTNPTLRLLRYNQAGTCGCSEIAVLSGKMADGVIEFQVTGSRIEADPEDTIKQEGDISSTLGYYNPASGNTWYNDGYLGDTAEAEPYEVPGAAVSLALAPASNPGFPVRTGEAVVDAGGGFMGTLPTGGLPGGDYVLTATACYGPDSCGSSSEPVTI